MICVTRGSGSVVERCLAKANVAGPNPVSRSNRFSLGRDSLRQQQVRQHRTRRGTEPERSVGPRVIGHPVSRSDKAKYVSHLACVSYYIALWHHSQVVRQRSAKPLFPSPSLGGASKKMPKWRNGRRKGLKIPRPQKRTGSSPVSSTMLCRRGSIE